jgi:hypothetical protein
VTYVIGDFSQVSRAEQAEVEFISEMSPRRVWNQPMGGMYEGGM